PAPPPFRREPPRTLGATSSRLRVARTHEPAGRRPVRLRPDLPRRVGALVAGAAHDRPARGPEARTRSAARGPAPARARRLGLRRELAQQHHAEEDDPASPSVPGA